MRLLVTVRLSVEKGNDLVANPDFVKTIEEVLAAHKAAPDIAAAAKKYRPGR